jgi:hypothetical protein
VERAAVISAVDFLFGAAGVSERGVGEDGDEGIQFGIELVDAGETVARELDRREGTLFDFAA